MQPDTPIKLSMTEHNNLLTYVRNIYMFLGGADVNLRAGLEQKDRTYYRENDWTEEQVRARRANKNGDAKRMQNPVVPIVSPQVETAVGYLTEVYLTGEPFFGVVAPPAQVNAATQMETVISDNARRTGWRNEFMKCFRDGLKYNVMAMEMAWDKKKIFSIVNDPAKPDKSAGTPMENLYEGNFAHRVDLYNAILDTRVLPTNIHSEGEFAGYVKLKTRTAMKQKILDLGTSNVQYVTQALQSNTLTYTIGASAPGQYYIPLINPDAVVNPTTIGTNWLSWSSNIKNPGMEYKDLYEEATIYVRIMPSDFGLNRVGAPNTPQIFKLIIVNQNWIIYMQRMTNAHNFLPIIVGQPFDDGLGYQAKSYGDNVAPYQDMSSSLWASGIESQRRLVYDRLFYDPSRISKTDIDKVSSVARIPVKAAAYGKPISEAVWSMTYRNDNVVQVLDMAAKLQSFSNVANGTNGPQQGQFQKGNKTRQEFDVTMAGANSRPRMFAISIEDQFMTPLKEVTKMNILQYQGAAKIYNIPKNQEVAVDPKTLRAAALDFKLSDGQTPSEKLLNGDLVNQVAQLGMAVPQINAEYDIAGMLIYNLKQQGAYWLDSFKRTPEGMKQYMENTAAMTTAQADPKNRETPSQTAQNSPQTPPSGS